MQTPQVFAVFFILRGINVNLMRGIFGEEYQDNI
jgi:hypothetical protein|nr:MAG TPA: hypothetical protein [Caudoviricetes sp.]